MPPGEHVAHRVQMRAAVMVDHAFRIAGRARGVVERDRVPLVRRHGPGEVGIATGEEILVGDRAERGGRAERILDVDDVGPLGRRHPIERRLHHGRELAVGDQHLGAAVAEDEGDGRGVEPDVERVQHRAQHRHAEMRLEQRRHVRRQHGDGITAPDATSGEGGGQAAAARIGLGPAPPGLAMNDGGARGPDRSGAGDEAQRRERRMVGGVLRQIERAHPGPPAIARQCLPIRALADAGSDDRRPARLPCPPLRGQKQTRPAGIGVAAAGRYWPETRRMVQKSLVSPRLVR